MPLLLLAYPFLVHLAVRSEQPIFGFVAIALLAWVILFEWLLARRLWAWCAALLITAAAWWIAFAADAVIMLYLPPILIPLALAAFFGRTLRAGSVPLISRISEAMRKEPLPPEVARYTRRVTIMWVAAFLFMAIESLLLALFAPRDIWLMITNVANYVLIAVLMVGEYLYHSRRYPNKVHNNLGDFVRDLVRVDYKKLLQD